MISHMRVSVGPSRAPAIRPRALASSTRGEERIHHEASANGLRRHTYQNCRCRILSRAFPSRPAGSRRRTQVLAHDEAMAADSPSSSSSGAVVGIDLGTTNSVVAVVKDGAPVIIPDKDSGNVVPSVVAFTPNGKILVGEKARRYAVMGPSHTFHSVKRFIGRAADDPTVAEDRARVAYTVEEADEDEDDAAVLLCSTVDGGILYPEEVSAQVLARLLQNAEEAIGKEVTKAVISVPAYFDDEQKAATTAAGQIAGLETVRLIREPVAAALAYGIDLKEDKTVMVFDLGGGTFDVSILEVGGGVVEVLATGGDSHLGGDDWDAAIAEWIAEEHLKPQGVDVKDPQIVANLRMIAEQSKVQLSSVNKVSINMPVGGADGGGTEVVLTRGAFEKLTAPLFRRCQQPMEHACWQAGVDLGQVRDEELRLEEIRQGKSKKQAGKVKNRRMPVSEVLLVGGATRMPGIKKFIENVMGVAPRDTVNPDEAVAQGAAIQAGILDGQITNLFVMDVWQASLMRALAKHQQEGEEEEEEESGGSEASSSETIGDLVDDFDEDPLESQLRDLRGSGDLNL